MSFWRWRAWSELCSYNYMSSNTLSWCFTDRFEFIWDGERISNNKWRGDESIVSDCREFHLRTLKEMKGMHCFNTTHVSRQRVHNEMGWSPCWNNGEIRTATMAPTRKALLAMSVTGKIRVLFSYRLYVSCISVMEGLCRVSAILCGKKDSYVEPSEYFKTLL